MSSETPRRRTLESLKKEAKSRVTAELTLREAQHQLAREQGFSGWSALKEALEPKAEISARSLALFEAMATALLDAYHTGTREAMERHYGFTWHRRAWDGMRRYVLADLGLGPESPGNTIDIGIDDARLLVAREHGFDGWPALVRFVSAMPGGTTITRSPSRVMPARADEETAPIFESRDWRLVLDALARHPEAALDANGNVTDAMAADLATLDGVVSLRLGGSKALGDEGVRRLAGLHALRHLDLSGTAITDDALAVLATLRSLESISLGWTRVTDRGMTHLAGCELLRKVDLMGTATGDAAITALAGKPRLADFRSGNGITDHGLALLRSLPVFATWHGGDVSMALLSYQATPNYLSLRGSFTDRGMRELRHLHGLFALNLDASELRLSAAALDPLVELPNLGWLAVDAKDDWMPRIAAMPRLRFLGCQDTTAGDDGFEALGRSRSLEYLWGRRCHNLRRRGFAGLSRIPTLRALSVSCLNVDDEGLALLPEFPALRELMPMDIPYEGYRHVRRCERLEALVLMYCRDTTDLATEAIAGMPNLSYYFNSYTRITDRTPEILSRMDRLERITFDGCHRLTDAGVAALARLPRLRELRVSGSGLTTRVADRFPKTVTVRYFS